MYSSDTLSLHMQAINLLDSLEPMMATLFLVTLAHELEFPASTNEVTRR